jgi:hypothetical protein
MPSIDVEVSSIMFRENAHPDGGVYLTPAMRFNNHLWSVKIDYKRKEIHLVKPIELIKPIVD